MAARAMRLEVFKREMFRWANLHIPAIGRAVHVAVNEAIYKGIVMRTPVLTGRARGNWDATIGAPSEEFGERVFGGSVTGEPVTAAEKSEIDGITSQLEALPLGSQVSYITNNLNYIIPLEKGSSPKATAKAMVERTIISTLDGLQINIAPKVT